MQQPNYTRLAKALTAVTDHHLLTVLDTAAQYWHTHANCLERHFTGPDQHRTEHCGRYYGALRLVAYLLIIHDQAWRMFCAELTLDPDC